MLYSQENLNKCIKPIVRELKRSSTFDFSIKPFSEFEIREISDIAKSNKGDNFVSNLKSPNTKAIKLELFDYSSADPKT